VNLQRMLARDSVWFKPILVTACLCALAIGCSFNSPLKPPPGWTGTPSVFGIQGFKSPDGTQEILMDHPQGAGVSHHRKGENWTPIRICGNHYAELIVGRGTHDGKDMRMEAVFTNWNGQRVVAMYARPYGSPADPGAEKSIRSLCSY